MDEKLTLLLSARIAPDSCSQVKNLGYWRNTGFIKWSKSTKSIVGANYFSRDVDEQPYTL